MKYSISPPFVSRLQSIAALHMSKDMTGNVADTTFDLPDEDDEGVKSLRQQAGISSSELPLNPQMTEIRRARLELEEKTARRFLSGDSLHLLRQKVLELRVKLLEARDSGDMVKVSRLSQSILRAQQMDAEFIYQVSYERMEAATRAGLLDEAETYRKEAMIARSALPQFNMGGLWIGRFGNEFQMVNISYVGDLLVAHKVTGNKNVPKGEISFQVDLSPKGPTDVLEPIELNEETSLQWGQKFLQRFAGKGQVASAGFKHREWMDGQLIVVDRYFSFAWLPIAHQVFFGRPSAELTLKMLSRHHNVVEVKGSSSISDSDLVHPSELDQMRSHLSRCWEETEFLSDDLEVSDSIFKSDDQSHYYHQNGCFE
jgi:uncharacterized protein (DUF1499 family)